MTGAACSFAALSEPTAVRPLVELLHQLFTLIETLTDEEYTRKPVGVVESSIGGHVRHNLDHITSLLRGLPAGRVCYDCRARNTAVEHNRTAALGAILSLEHDLLAFDWCEVPNPVVLSALVSPDLPPVEVHTSAERELAFVVSHTIHHNALVRVMVKLIGADVPAEFGYAPATITHKRSRTCVR
jgi:uncharacterized damage-inducible protein DinB